MEYYEYLPIAGLIVTRIDEVDGDVVFFCDMDERAFWMHGHRALKIEGTLEDIMFSKITEAIAVLGLGKKMKVILRTEKGCLISRAPSNNEIFFEEVSYAV